jgi:hypothetical protein
LIGGRRVGFVGALGGLGGEAVQKGEHLRRPKATHGALFSRRIYSGRKGASAQPFQA